MIRLLYLDYRAMLRERKVQVVVGLYVYAVLVMPFLLSRPPAHMLSAIETWFHTTDRFALFLYMWTDLTMNKIAVVAAVVVAGGVVARERDTGVLPLLLSKPIGRAHYFLVRLGAALAVLSTLYVAAHLAGAVYFARAVPGFRPGAFFASMSLHLFTVLFSGALAAAFGVLLKKRSLAMLVSLLVLFALMGGSFVGFYQPAWRTVSLVNPFSLGVEALAHLDALAPAHILMPMAALGALTLAAAGLGAAAARRMEV
jgi:ABC-2 type transport system permease protein